MKILITLIAIFILGNIAYYIRYLIRGRKGLDQWPEPHGHYYDEWLSLKEAGDYYDWLSNKMGNREPWKAWAERERNIVRNK